MAPLNLHSLRHQSYFSRSLNNIYPAVPDRRVGALARECEKVMRARGRAIGIMEDHAGQVCALGAMVVAVGGSTAHTHTPEQTHEYQALFSAYMATTGHPPHRHNDNTRNDEMVLSVFRHIADTLDPMDPPPPVPVGHQEDHELAGGPSS